jgi:hypothetical protein
MMQNLDEDSEIDRNLRLSSSKSKVEENDEYEVEDDLQQKKEASQNSPNKSKGKNVKISNEASVSMMEWLL